MVYRVIAFEVTSRDEEFARTSVTAAAVVADELGVGRGVGADEAIGDAGGGRRVGVPKQRVVLLELLLRQRLLAPLDPIPVSEGFCGGHGHDQRVEKPCQ